jgi:hypothetical protein
MLAAGVPSVVVFRQLGHASPNVTAYISRICCVTQLDEAAEVVAARSVTATRGKQTRLAVVPAPLPRI